MSPGAPGSGKPTELLHKHSGGATAVDMMIVGTHFSDTHNAVFAPFDLSRLKNDYYANTRSSLRNVTTRIVPGSHYKIPDNNSLAWFGL